MGHGHLAYNWFRHFLHFLRIWCSSTVYGSKAFRLGFHFISLMFHFIHPSLPAQRMILNFQPTRCDSAQWTCCSGHSIIRLSSWRCESAGTAAIETRCHGGIHPVPVGMMKRFEVWKSNLGCLGLYRGWYIKGGYTYIRSIQSLKLT